MLKVKCEVLVAVGSVFLTMRKAYLKRKLAYGSQQSRGDYRRWSWTF
jgi:hypothetical protein